MIKTFLSKAFIVVGAFTIVVSIAYAADVAISTLSSQTGAATADNDVLPIVDVSGNQTNKITVGELGVKIANGLDADDIDDASTTNKFVTSGDITKLSNTSGTNTGDQATITGNAGTATALAVDGANCTSGDAAGGVDAQGNAQDCFTPSGGSSTAAATTVDTTNFDGNLSGTDTDVKTALETIDDLSLGGGGAPSGAAGGDLGGTYPNPAIASLPSAVDMSAHGIYNVRAYAGGATIWDGVTNADAATIAARNAACAATGRKTLLFENGSFELNAGNVVHACDDLTVVCNNATIIVPSTATAGDTNDDSTTVYDNGIFYVDNNDTLDNFAMKGCKFDIAKDEISAFQFGGTGETVSSTILRTNIDIVDVEQEGGSGWQLRRTEGFYVKGKIQETIGTSLFFNANNDGEIDIDAKYCGVNGPALTTFANSSCLNCNNCSNVNVESPEMLWSGGSMIVARATTLDIEGFRVNGGNLSHCGEACVGISVPSFAGANRSVRSSGVRGTVMRGYTSQDDSVTPGQSHSAIAIGVDNGTGYCEDVWADDNTISYIGPGETWDEATNDIAGTVINDLKDHEANSGGTEYISIFGEDGDAHCRNFSVNNNRLSYAKRVGILIDRAASGTVSNNNILRTGWNRNASDVPLATAHAIFVNLSADVKVNGNNVTDHGPGVDGDSSLATFTIGVTDSIVTLANNTLSGYSVDTSTAATAFGGVFFNGTADGLFTAIDGYDAATRVSMHASNNTVENTHLNLTAVGSNYRMSDEGDLVVLSDGYVMNRTGSSTMEEGVLNTVCSSSGSTITMTLQAAEFQPGVKSCFLNEDAGICNIAAATGTVNGDTSLAANESNCYTGNADGDWYGLR